TLQSSKRRIVLGLTLGDDGHGCLSFGLALGHYASRCVDADDGALQLRLRLAALRLQLVGVHVHEDLSAGDEVALPDQDFADPPRYPGGDVDLGRLDPPIAAGDALRQAGIGECLPRVVADAGNDHDRDNDEPAFAGAWHVEHSFGLT